MIDSHVHLEWYSPPKGISSRLLARNLLRLLNQVSLALIDNQVKAADLELFASVRPMLLVIFIGPVGWDHNIEYILH